MESLLQSGYLCRSAGNELNINLELIYKHLHIDLTEQPQHKVQLKNENDDATGSSNPILDIQIESTEGCYIDSDQELDYDDPHDDFLLDQDDTELKVEHVHETSQSNDETLQIGSNFDEVQTQVDFLFDPVDQDETQPKVETIPETNNRITSSDISMENRANIDEDYIKFEVEMTNLEALEKEESKPSGVESSTHRRSRSQSAKEKKQFTCKYCKYRSAFANNLREKFITLDRIYYDIFLHNIFFISILGGSLG